MRLSTACDQCKARKVKCDGGLPCSHCTRRKDAACHFTPTVKRPRTEAYDAFEPCLDDSLQPRTAQWQPTPSSKQGRPPKPVSITEEDETAVPRDSRLLRDAQGKLMFIGDCAPLSFLQTVRQLITTLVDPDAFVTKGHDALLEQSDFITPSSNVLPRSLQIPQSLLQSAISSFVAVTSGMLDIGDIDEINDHINQWMSQSVHQGDKLLTVNYLILAIGLQSSNEQLSSEYFRLALRNALTYLTIDTSPLAVQAFLLVAVYMLRNCQPNGAFLYFGLAARASYSIGMHRAEVNARFEKEVQDQRERLYKSLKVFDLFISVILGRPPALSDVDCSVPYQISTISNERIDLLDDVIQILLVVQTIAEEVYPHGRKISLQLTRQISQRLKQWANQRMQRLNALILSTETSRDLLHAVGACQALATYYYAIMFLSKPFLMYEAYQVLGPDTHNSLPNQARTGRRALADGCVDAACGLVDMVCRMTKNNSMPPKMPTIVSWLFTSSLVLGVALTAGFGRVMEKYLVSSITALEYFSKHDAQAAQYSLIARSLLSTAVDYLQRQELNERLARGKASSELFGLPVESYTSSIQEANKHINVGERHDIPSNSNGIAPDTATLFTTPNWEDFDISALGDMFDASQDFFGTLNLFPMSDTYVEPDVSSIT